MIPDALWNLMSLSYLHLEFNNFNTSNILGVLGNSTSLSYLDLSYNELQGEFPRHSRNSSSLKHLDLSVNKLNGQLPHLLEWLPDSTGLEYLYLWNNLLTGLFPNMSRFSHLKEMQLGNNKLNGAPLEGTIMLPNLRILGLYRCSFTRFFHSNLRLPNLELLDLSSNKLTSRLPNLSLYPSLRVVTFTAFLKESFGNLSKIEYLAVGNNKLEGVITEAHLSHLPHLTFLDLSFNLNITLSISPSWIHPAQFKHLNLANCKMGPNFPKWLQNQNQLRYLDMSNSEIFAIVPDWFWGNIHSCWYLNMSHNHIGGVLPNSSSEFKEIKTIDLSSNEFTGSLPHLPPAIDNIDLSRNKFSGTILNFCNFINDNIFIDLSNNLLSGEILEHCFTNWLSVSYVNLAYNNFSGEIPAADNSTCSVSSLHLRSNSFTGEIPRSLMNCRELKILDLGENEFSGKIPEWLGESMPELGVLILKSNMFNGSLPSSICHLANIQVLDISSNRITGAIPKCMNKFNVLSSEVNPNWNSLFYKSRNGTVGFQDSASVMWKGKEESYINTLGLLKVIDLSSNELFGEIPYELTSLIGLVGLNLSRNSLAGTIPRDIDQLKLLNFLDLSRNNLSGSIPPALSKLSHLGVLDLSFNDLSGRIPWDTHMQTFGASAYLGNDKLCGLPLVSRPCPEDEKPKNRTNERDDSEDEDKFITRGFYISMLVGFFVAFWVTFWTLFFNKWWNLSTMKVCTIVTDWLYVQILVNKRRLLSHFSNA